MEPIPWPAVGEMRRIEQARWRRQGRAERCIGRGAELARIAEALTGASEGRGAVVLVAGDPGIGKTHLAEEAARRAERAGFRVHWGRCHADEGAPALWPWLQVLRAHAEQSDPGVLRAALGAHGPVLAAMLPSLREHVPAVAPVPALQAEETRFRALEAITGFVRRAAAREPWLVLLDDLHWADLPTLQLLRFAARELRDAPVLLIGTVRDAELDPRGPALRLLREVGALRIDLAGFGDGEVADLLAPQLGEVASSAWAPIVRAATGGNPFFVDRVARLVPQDAAATDPASLRIPEEVRDVLLGQLARLDADAGQALGVAAVIGRDFEIPLLARVLGSSGGSTLRRLAPAMEARLVRPGVTAGRYEFVHSLIRDVVYAVLPAGVRDETHLAVARALEAAPPRPEDADRIAQLAHHYVAAAHLGEGERAAQYAERAAAAATTLSGYEEAARHLEAALRLLEGGPVATPRRADLLLRLGEAHAGASRHAEARRAFGLAAGEARAAGDAERLARAALGHAGFFASLGFVDAEVAGLLGEAIGALGERLPALRSRLASRLALELTFGHAPDLEAREAVSARALALARESGDEAALAHALYARQLAQGIDHIPSTWSESAERAARAREIDLALAAFAWKAGEALQLGDLAGFDEAVAAHAAVASTALHRTAALNQLIWRSLRAVFDGSFADFERLNAEVPLRFAAPQHAAYAAPSVLCARWHQGRLAEMAPMVALVADAMPGTASGQAWLAWIHTELGDRDAAVARLERLAASDFALLARSPFGHVESTLAAQAAAFVGDAAAIAWFEQRLLPVSRQRAVQGTGLCDFGTVARSLGLLAAARGDLDLAVRRLDEALAADARLAARPHQVHDQVDLARVLLRRGAAGDGARADALCARAREAAEAFGMRSALERLDALRRPAAASAVAPGGPAEAELAQGDGGRWTLRRADRVHHLEAVKGLLYLRELLRRPGRAVPALELADARAGALRDALAPLRDALADAEELGDAERSAALRDEIEARLGARDGAVERARVNVTRALQLAVRRIDAVDPVLGRDLAANLETGTFCRYAPDPVHPVRWIA